MRRISAMVAAVVFLSVGAVAAEAAGGKFQALAAERGVSQPSAPTDAELALKGAGWDWDFVANVWDLADKNAKHQKYTCYKHGADISIVSAMTAAVHRANPGSTINCTSGTGELVAGGTEKTTFDRWIPVRFNSSASMPTVEIRFNKREAAMVILDGGGAGSATVSVKQGEPSQIVAINIPELSAKTNAVGTGAGRGVAISQNELIRAAGKLMRLLNNGEPTGAIIIANMLITNDTFPDGRTVQDMLKEVMAGKYGQY